MAAIQKVANLQGQDYAGKFGILSTGRDNKDQVVAQTSNGICFQNKCEFDLTKLTSISAAQVAALFTTPIQIVPTPEAGYGIHIRNLIIRHDAGTAYSVTAGRNLVAYINSTAASTAIAVVGFLDQATAQIQASGGLTTFQPVDATGAFLTTLTGNPSGGTFGLQVLVKYDIIPTGFTA